MSSGGVHQSNWLLTLRQFSRFCVRHRSRAGIVAQRLADAIGLGCEAPVVCSRDRKWSGSLVGQVLFNVGVTSGFPVRCSRLLNIAFVSLMTLVLKRYLFSHFLSITRSVVEDCGTSIGKFL